MASNVLVDDGMGVYRFEDLRVWQAAKEQSDPAQFLRYAFASNGELKSAYYAAEGRNYLSSSDTADLIALNESIAKMIRRWQATLEPGEPKAADRRRTKGRRRTKDQGRTKNQGPGTKDNP